MGPHPSKTVQIDRRAQVDFPKLITTNINQNRHCRESSVDSQLSEEGYDTSGKHFSAFQQYLVPIDRNCWQNVFKPRAFSFFVENEDEK